MLMGPFDLHLKAQLDRKGMLDLDAAFRHLILHVLEISNLRKTTVGIQEFRHRKILFVRELHREGAARHDEFDYMTKSCPLEQVQ